MLYLSTRNKNDSYTAYRALHEEHAPDGGMFVPLQMPVYTTEELEKLKDASFGQIAALILNTFFPARLDGWDIDFSVGRHPLRLNQMSRQLLIAEAWHNLESRYACLEKMIYRKLCGGEACGNPPQWAQIAIRIAVLFGLYGQAAAAGITELDIAVAVGDFSAPMAAWYARKMGLPIRTIICSCEDNGAAWDLIHRGEMNNSGASRSDFPHAIECLIYSTLGQEEALRFAAATQQGSTYQLDGEQRQALGSGMFAAVIGSTRLPAVINSIFRTNDYITDNRTALCFGGLQDYRARFGESRHTLIIAENDPALAAEDLAAVLGILAETIKNRVNSPKE